MWEQAAQAIVWLMLAYAGIQAVVFVGFLVWTAWSDIIRPGLIPADEIEREAERIIASYPDPELEAFARHERAWYRSDGPGQTYWYRVRKAVRRRLEAG